MMIYKLATDTKWHKAEGYIHFDPFMGMKVGDAVGWHIETHYSAVKKAREHCYRYNENSPYKFTTEKRYVLADYGPDLVMQPKRVKDVGEAFLIITKVK
jgi:hypothetical protein